MVVSSRGGELAVCVLSRALLAGVPLSALSTTADGLPEPAEGSDELDFFEKRR